MLIDPEQLRQRLVDDIDRDAEYLDDAAVNESNIQEAQAFALIGILSELQAIRRVLERGR